MGKHCELNRTAMVRLKNIFSRQQKNNTYLVLSFRCLQKAARFLLREKMRVVISFVSPRYSQHIVGLWKKEIQRVSKNKSNSLSGRK